jgi:shikimate dehydrogenase
LKTVHVVNRSSDKATAMAASFGSAVHPATWSDVPRLLKGMTLIANTTSLGMQGKEPLTIDLSPMAKDAVAADVIYVPLTTPFLAQARDRGFRTSDGLDMLLHQAVRGFANWFGIKPEVTPELRALLVADILKSSPA